jgi:glucose-6-phosphate isomerase
MSTTKEDARPVAAGQVKTEALLRLDTAHMYLGQGTSPRLTPADIDALGPELRRVHAAVDAGARTGLDGEYACLTLHEHMPAWLPAIEEMAQAIRQFADVIVVGIGGSSLGAKAIDRAIHAVHPETPRPRLHFLENVDPYLLDTLLARTLPETTAVIAISKSGGTIESVVQYLILRDWLKQALGEKPARRQQWLVTDPAHGWLHELAEREALPRLPVPPRVGGRYSVLSPVGLLPLAASGVDIRALLAGAAANANRCHGPDPTQNPALELAALYYLQDVRRGVRISIMMPYVNPLRLFVDWYCQLWAESLGKHIPGRPDQPPAGTLPVRAMGAVDQHSQLQMYLESRPDKMFTFLTLDSWSHDRTVPLPAAERDSFPYLHHKRMSEVIDAEFRATRAVITDTGHPSLTLHLPALDAHVLGQLIDLYQRTTVYTGLLYGINPLDQPAVEKGKQLALEYLRRR